MLFLMILIISCTNIKLKDKSNYECFYGCKDLDDTLEVLDSKIRNIKLWIEGVSRKVILNEENALLDNMIYALTIKDMETLKSLIKDIDYREITTSEGNDILCFAAYLGYKDAALLLLEDAKVKGEIKNSSEWIQKIKPIEFLLVNNCNSPFADRKAILDKMIELDPSILSEENEYIGHNMLMYTMMIDDLDMFEYILKAHLT